MSDQAPQKKEEGGGAPAWVMTFADLMSLLMCFFVLLLSFAEMDLLKFKQIAGSMKMAFGVQREIKVKEPPKGTSVIAREFAPGRPTPTPLNEVRQNTIDETKQTLEFTDAMNDKKEAESMEAGEQDDGSETAPVQKHSETERSENDLLESGEDNGELEQLAAMTEQMQAELKNLAEQLEEGQPEVEQASQLAAEIENQIAELMNKDKDKEQNPEVSEEPANEKTQADAQKLLQALAPEVEKGMVSIETQGNKIVLRIKEKGSFPSGSSDLKGDFMPVIGKLKDSLRTIDGKVVVAGHTDNVPIKTRRFRSNWELSSSRAVTVVHGLLEDSKLEAKRFAVEGHGDAHPLVPNDSVENRALNRRVELTIIQGEDVDRVSELSSDEAAEPASLEEMQSLPNSDQVDNDNADAVDMQAEENPPLPEGIQPIVIDPFAGVMETVVDEEAEQAQVEAEKVTIDVGNLRDRLKAINEGLNKDESIQTETETGQAE